MRGGASPAARGPDVITGGLKSLPYDYRLIYDMKPRARPAMLSAGSAIDCNN